MAWVPVKSPRSYWAETVSASPRSLTISSEWPSERTSAAGHVLEVVGELLQVAVVVQHGAAGVVGLVLDRLDLGAQLAHARLDLGPVALQPLG